MLKFRLSLPLRIAAGVLCLIATSMAFADDLRPHEITYHTTFKGFSAGDLRLTLSRDVAADNWVYETRAFPSFLASLIISPESLERSWFRVTPQGIQPKRYALTDGGHDTDHQSDLTYDWSRNRISGKVDGKPYDAALEASQQDVNTIRLAPVVDLLAGREPGEYALLDGREVKHYTYPKQGTAKLQTDLGELDTVIYESQRKNYDGTGRTWRYWFAPSLGWLPVRIEQREDGRARLTFTVRTLKWTSASAPAHPATN
jgi:Protein of unknown function (DUF3108)